MFQHHVVVRLSVPGRHVIGKHRSPMIRCRDAAVVLLLFSVIGSGERWMQCCCAQDETDAIRLPQLSQDTTVQIHDAVIHGFRESHGGWSSDEVLIRSDLNAKFLAASRRYLPASVEVSDAQLNWTMLNLRKAKKLPGAVTRRGHSRHDGYRHAAEIAARSIEDKYQQNIDRVFCVSDARAEFDRLARQLAPTGTSADALRRSALALRKSSRLRPELAVRVADWGRNITKTPLAKIQENVEVVSAGPGIYIFYDSSGYLYIGESQNVRERLSQHVQQSDRNSLASYLSRQGADLKNVTVEVHSFDAKSPARKSAMRRAYESELIRSRHPRFNVRR